MARQPLSAELVIRLVRREELSGAERQAVISLCNRAFEEDCEPALRTFTDATHLLGHVEGALVSHALWYTRWLEVGNGPLLRTAYVEGVATEETHRGRGYASALMRRLVKEVDGYDLAALSPSDAQFYARLGWELWRGPLSIRSGGGLIPSPSDEEVMIYGLAKTPALDISAPLSTEWREGELW